MTTTVPGTRLKITEVTPACWRVSIDNPPLNLFDPEMLAETRLLMDRIERRTRRSTTL